MVQCTISGTSCYNCLFAIALLSVGLFATSSAEKYVFKEEYHETPVDHFSFSSNATFQLRYIYNDTYWNKSAGAPIFFYTGNEGDITWFAKNTGFVWEIAPEFQALVLFVEHRYYGKSMPFGNLSLASPDKSGYLTSEQALADFATFLQWFRRKHDATKNPVYAFGGSYGGMLTAWMRIKYPHIVDGGIAASAPVLQFEGLTSCNAFSRIVSDDFELASPECANTIRKSWEHLNNVGAADGGRDWLSRNWKLCKPLKTKDDVEGLKSWLSNIYGNLAMVDYPYAANFLAPLPAYPIKEICSKMKDSTLPEKQLLTSLFNGINVYFNYTGDTKCLDINQNADSALGDQGWDYQACTEMVMPMCNDGIHDIFEPAGWNETAFAEQCMKRWGVKPRPYMAEIIYGGRDIYAASNIVFSNGLLDPWYGGGILESLSDSLIAIQIPEGAHHLDLRASNKDDPPSVLKARELEKEQLRKWIAAYHERLHEEETQEDLDDFKPNSLDEKLVYSTTTNQIYA